MTDPILAMRVGRALGAALCVKRDHHADACAEISARTSSRPHSAFSPIFASEPASVFYLRPRIQSTELRVVASPSVDPLGRLPRKSRCNSNNARRSALSPPPASEPRYAFTSSIENSIDRAARCLKPSVEDAASRARWGALPLEAGARSEAADGGLGFDQTTVVRAPAL